MQNLATGNKEFKELHNLMSKQDILEFLPISKSTFYYWIASGAFPKSDFQLGARILF
jgi:predicted DNA-binding transcriptional regulator AlpA